MIAIVDYGMGNLRSVQKGFESVGYKAVVTDRAKDLADADAVVLPGVGGFGPAIQKLEKTGLANAIRNEITEDKPYLGICLGLQLLFEESEERGIHKGLGILPGRVVRFRQGITVPHMGWNQIQIQKSIPILEGIPDNAYFYFVHSYYVVPADPEVIATTTDYDLEFTSMVARGNLFASQFHPEKSQSLGLRILRNFGRFVEAHSSHPHSEQTTHQEDR